MTHSELVQVATRWLKRKGFPVVLSDADRPLLPSGEQPDALGFRSGVSCLVEVKASRADFLADRKKSFRLEPCLGVGDWRFYLAPVGTIPVHELPPGWGLINAVGRRIYQEVGVPGNTIWESAKPFTGNHECEMRALYSIARRLSSQRVQVANET